VPVPGTALAQVPTSGNARFYLCLGTGNLFVRAGTGASRVDAVSEAVQCDGRREGGANACSRAHFRPDVEEEFFFAPGVLKRQPGSGSGTGRPDLPTKSQWPFSELKIIIPCEAPVAV
jgi:hypothetical protein